MDDYISRKEALAALGEEPYVWDEDSDSEIQEYRDWECHYNAISAIPAANVVEVKNGLWNHFDLTRGRRVYVCTVCEQSTECPTEMGKPIYAYCPNCGAKMDGGQDDV